MINNNAGNVAVLFPSFAAEYCFASQEANNGRAQSPRRHPAPVTTLRRGDDRHLLPRLLIAVVSVLVAAFPGSVSEPSGGDGRVCSPTPAVIQTNSALPPAPAPPRHATAHGRTIADPARLLLHVQQGGSWGGGGGGGRKAHPVGAAGARQAGQARPAVRL